LRNRRKAITVGVGSSLNGGKCSNRSDIDKGWEVVLVLIDLKVMSRIRCKGTYSGDIRRHAAIGKGNYFKRSDTAIKELLVSSLTCVSFVRSSIYEPTFASILRIGARTTFIAGTNQAGAAALHN
jgi:hypothetical protein